MKKLSELKVDRHSISMAFGLFSIVFEGNRKLYCCLVKNEGAMSYNTEPLFLKEVDVEDSGYDGGLNAITNRWAIDSYNPSEIKNFIGEQAKIADLKVKH